VEQIRYLCAMATVAHSKRWTWIGLISAISVVALTIIQINAASKGIYDAPLSRIILSGFDESAPFPLRIQKPLADNPTDKPLEDHVNRTIAIFYHLYVPDNSTGRVDKALNVLHEQINQLGRSYLTNQTDFSVVLYYNTVGNSLQNLHSVIDNLCQEAGVASCQHLNHFPSGTFEEATHASMQSYCQRQSPLDYDAPLLYFHSKGAFQDHGGKQKQWRRNMLAAIAGPQCTMAMTQSTSHPLDSCNVCGLHFLPIWQMIMAGNFFVTKCSHVKKLLDPFVYKKEMLRVTQPLSSLGFSLRVFAPKCDVFGASRWTPELWISSHPDVVPCDFGHHSADFLFYQREGKIEKLANKGELQLDFAPRHSFRAGWRHLQRKPHFDPWSDYSLLPGVLYRHLEIYNQVPHNSSWIWEWFPAGSLWRNYISEAITTVNVNANFSHLAKIEVGLAKDAVLHAVRNKTRLKSGREMENEARKFDNFDLTKC